MSLKYIRDTYGVPAKRGRRVEYIGNGAAIFAWHVADAMLKARENQT